MALIDEIKQFTDSIPIEIKEKNGIYELSVVVAERKAFLTKKKLEYIAKFRIVEDDKTFKFTEMLKESGSGVSASAGGDEMTPGFGFKAETYKTTGGPREGSIEEQSNLFGKTYQYKFNFKDIRPKIEKMATAAGYKFAYQITPAGL